LTIAGSASLDVNLRQIWDDLQTIERLFSTVELDAEKYRDPTTAGFLEGQTRALVFSGSTASFPTSGLLSVTAPPANRRVEVVIDFLVPVATVFHSASVRGWSGGEEREAYTDFFPGGPPAYGRIAPRLPPREMVAATNRRDVFNDSGIWATYRQIPRSIDDFTALWNESALMRHAYVATDRQPGLFEESFRDVAAWMI
jgi:hypothetical protein